MKTNYKSLECNMWNSTQFRSLSNIERLIYIYLIAGPQTRILGISKIDFDWICFLFKISAEKLQEIFYLFESMELIVYSPKTSEVYLPCYFIRYAQRGGVIMTRALRREWTSIEDRSLARMCIEQNRAFLNARPDYYNKTADAFLQEAELLLNSEGALQEKKSKIEDNRASNSDQNIAALREYFDKCNEEESKDADIDEGFTDDDLLDSIPFIVNG